MGLVRDDAVLASYASRREERHKKRRLERRRFAGQGASPPAVSGIGQEFPGAKKPASGGGREAGSLTTKRFGTLDVSYECISKAFVPR